MVGGVVFCFHPDRLVVSRQAGDHQVDRLLWLGVFILEAQRDALAVKHGICNGHLGVEGGLLLGHFCHLGFQALDVPGGLAHVSQILQDAPLAVGQGHCTDQQQASQHQGGQAAPEGAGLFFFGQGVQPVADCKVQLRRQGVGHFHILRFHVASSFNAIRSLSRARARREQTAPLVTDSSRAISLVPRPSM